MPYDLSVVRGVKSHVFCVEAISQMQMPSPLLPVIPAKARSRSIKGTPKHKRRCRVTPAIAFSLFKDEKIALVPSPLMGEGSSARRGRHRCDCPFPLWGKVRMGVKMLAHRRLNCTNAIFSKDTTERRDYGGCDIFVRIKQTPSYSARIVMR